MGIEFPAALVLLMTVAWWVVVLYLALRFLRAFERSVDVQAHLARDIARLAHQATRDTSSPPAG